jgi:hypothetical protein
MIIGITTDIYNRKEFISNISGKVPLQTINSSNTHNDNDSGNNDEYQL